MRERVLSEGQQSDLEAILQENPNKSHREIQEYFNGTYKVALPVWKISNTKRTLGLTDNTPRQSRTAKEGTPITRLVNLLNMPSTTSQEMTEVVKMFEAEISALSGAIRTLAKREVVNSISLIRNARREMGDTITEEDDRRLSRELSRLRLSGK